MWCTDQACVECVLHTNDTMPLADVGTAIAADDGMYMCHGITSPLWCMHLWMTFLPVSLMLLLACAFLWHESSCRKYRQGRSSSPRTWGSAEVGRAEAVSTADASSSGNDQLLQQQQALGVQRLQAV